MKDKQNNNKQYKRKVNIFIVFLICSGLIWLISKLSETYTQRSAFKLSYVNAPDSLLLTGASKLEVDTRLRASGFKFLSYNFGREALNIDLSDVKSSKGNYFINKETYQKQIENQLPGNMTLLEVDQDTLFVYFKKLISKEVKVSPNLTINLEQNYLLEGPLVLDPPSITIRGPKSEIELVDEIFTVSSTFAKVVEDFNATVALSKPAELENTVYEVEQVKISGKVFKFSEQLIQVPVEVINLPEGAEIKTFPNTIPVLCKARLDRLKNLGPQDFELVADFAANRTQSQQLELKLLNKPDEVYDAQLMETKVEFILIRR